MRSILCLLLVASSVPAQREEADVEWQKKKATIAYGVVLVGRHKLDELAVGGDWRMGRNEASTLSTDMALIVGEQVVVPGSYRMKVGRPGEKDFSLMIEGGTMGEAPPTPGAVSAKAELQKPGQPSKNLEVTFKADGKASGAVQPAKITVTFGENQIVAPVTLVGTKTQKVQGWTIDSFSLPAEVVEKRVAENKQTPVLSFKKETGKKNKPFQVWNLVVTKDGAELWPAPVAPTDGNGFGDVKALDAAAMTKATSVKWEEGKDSKPNLESKVEIAKGKGATITLMVGKQTCTISIPEPKATS